MNTSTTLSTTTGTTSPAAPAAPASAPGYGYIDSAPSPQAGMSTAPTPAVGSAASSITAVGGGSPTTPGNTVSPMSTKDNKSADQIQDQDIPNDIRDWYPGDASHDGRPAWWNRIFCL
nr:uncharacterized protein CI109_006915 [Kwoniella shandongensis]KAA5524761.1 hypothetical protein CI109_006915 [Kwoniella shandongensis]